MRRGRLLREGMRRRVLKKGGLDGQRGWGYFGGGAGGGGGWKGGVGREGGSLGRVIRGRELLDVKAVKG